MGTEVYFILLVLAAPIYFLSNWFFRNRISNKNIRRFAIWASTILLAPLAYLLLISVWIYYMFSETKRKFNNEEWFKNKDIRFEMGDDIVKKKILIGKDSSEIKIILGDPNWREETQKEWIYDMGIGGGLGFQFHSLILQFDQSKVISVIHKRIND